MDVDATFADEDLREEDLAELSQQGLSSEQVRRQVQLLRHPPSSLRLDRPCTAGDGIRVLTEKEIEAANRTHEEACHAGRFLKFVPASGAASRMFKTLLAARGRPGALQRATVEQLAASGDPQAREILVFLSGITRFAFFDDLARIMSRDGLDAVKLAENGSFAPLVEFLVTEKGLDYAARPKGLLKFHRYGDGARTAFEEHLVEAVAYARDRTGHCRLHFTVSPKHRSGFEELAASVGPRYERRLETRFTVEFSQQKPITSTIALDSQDRLFRGADGRILLRPGGHGALIENLNELDGDLVYVKNIDNVVPDRLKGATIAWKKVLGGFLVQRQQQTFELLSLLSQTPATDVIERAARFAREELCLGLPADWNGRTREQRQELLLRKLNRPMRVCGIVRNTGEPGGGPFWVRDADETPTLQIVESAQVDPQSPEQQAIFRSSTHFNPVDLVCGVRDWRGRPFDLNRFVDPDAVFLSHKSERGAELKALERPGLWNGAMSDWITIFIEVPVITFNPVKTVNDLLRSQHQPD
jgi:hypothetical protein